MNNFNFNDINEHIDFLNSEKTKSFVKWIYSLSPYEFTAAAALIGFTIAPALNINEQVAIGNFLIETGQIILTINSLQVLKSPYPHPTYENSIQETKNEFNQKLASLQKQINSLKQSIRTTNQEPKQNKPL